MASSIEQNVNNTEFIFGFIHDTCSRLTIVVSLFTKQVAVCSLADGVANSFSVSNQRPDLAIQDLRNFFVEKFSDPRLTYIVS